MLQIPISTDLFNFILTIIVAFSCIAGIFVSLYFVLQNTLRIDEKNMKEKENTIETNKDNE